MIEKIELDNFYNDGFGWICRRCEKELNASGDAAAAEQKHSRLMREGEAESKKPQFSNAALAKWTDQTRRTLVCPRCGITESANKF